MATAEVSPEFRSGPRIWRITAERVPSRGTLEYPHLSSGLDARELVKVVSSLGSGPIGIVAME
jgi:hypothetical protein